jgi:hypothetical protein
MRPQVNMDAARCFKLFRPAARRQAPGNVSALHDSPPAPHCCYNIKTELEHHVPLQQ